MHDIPASIETYNRFKLEDQSVSWISDVIIQLLGDKQLLRGRLAKVSLLRKLNAHMHNPSSGQSINARFPTYFDPSESTLKKIKINCTAFLAIPVVAEHVSQPLYRSSDETGSINDIFTFPLCVFWSFSTVTRTRTLSNTATCTPCSLLPLGTVTVYAS